MSFTVLVTAIATTAINALLLFVFQEWFKARINESIKSEYARTLEVFKTDLGWESKKEEQAIQVAKIFSLWQRHHYFQKEDLNQYNSTRYHLQNEYWQLAMWLDAPILKIVNQALTNTGANPGLTHKEAMVQVRKLLWGADDPVIAGELCHWDAVPLNPPAVAAVPVPAQTQVVLP